MLIKFRRWVRFRWASHIRSLLLLAGVFIAAQFFPSILVSTSLIGSTPATQETGEQLEGSTAGVGWTPALESYRLAEDLEQRVNDERMARGLRPLVWHEGLADLARQWSEEMMVSGYRHSPDSFRIHPDVLGIGENILMGPTDTGEAHVGWMESDGHRQSILNPDFTTIGIGVVCRNDGRIWATQMFGVPLDARSSSGGLTPPVEPIVRRDPGRTCP